jgi:hypothetical protein
VGKFTEEDRETVRNEVAGVARHLQKKYPRTSCHEIRKFMKEIVDVTV